MSFVYRRWVKGVLPLAAFFLAVTATALVVTARVDDPYITTWRVSMILAGSMALIGLATSWIAMVWPSTADLDGSGSKRRAVGLFLSRWSPRVEAGGVYSIMVVEFAHFFYVGPMLAIFSDTPGWGRAFSHLAIAIASYILTRRHPRYRYAWSTR